VLAPATGWIDAMLREDLTAPRKQRHTIERIWSRLANEYDFCVSHSMVRDYVAVRRPEIIAAAARDGLSHKQFLADLLGTERAEQGQRRKFRMVRAAGFPRPKRIEDFDFAANPNVRPEQVGTLTDPEWVHKALPLCLIGDCGTGKSHLLIGIGTAMAEAGLHVRYVTTAALVNELVEAAGDKQLSRLIARYSKIDLLCLDEFGYVNLDKRGANLLFQIFTEREERHATAIASNSPFSEWKKIFTDQRLCQAVVDRITFQGTFINTGTDSYRLATTEAKLRRE
jgi:DNA replication protein DnaC